MSQERALGSVAFAHRILLVVVIGDVNMNENNVNAHE